MTAPAKQLPPPVPAGTPYAQGETAVAYADGASRGNPGAAAFGCAYARLDGTVLCGEGEVIGHATNNVAEYRGAIAALERLAAWGVRRAVLRMDSELVVRQARGQYRVKQPHLQQLHARLLGAARGLEDVDFQHVPRAKNAIADGLANRALDAPPPQA